jgi:hypothetical protein
VRPTYSEIVNFVAKRSEPEASSKTYVALEVMNNVSADIERKFEITAKINRDQVEDYKHELQTFREITTLNLQKIFKKIDKHVEERKGVIRFARNWRIAHIKKDKARTIFYKWKNLIQNKKKSKILIKKIHLDKDNKRLKRGWEKLKHSYLLTRMKKFEGNSIKALLRADDCQTKLLDILPEIVSLKKNKANAEDVQKLSSIVQRTNYESVFKDLAGMIKEESSTVYEKLESVSVYFTHQIKELDKEIKHINVLVAQPGIQKDLSSVKSKLSSLSNAQALLNERLDRIDYCNIKEDNEFKIEILSKQVKDLENKIVSFSVQETSQEHLYPKPGPQYSRFSSRSIVHGSAYIGKDTNASQIIESNLSVNGTYLRPNKRIASASPSKQSTYTKPRNQKAIGSFSNSFSLNESPVIWSTKVI